MRFCVAQVETQCVAVSCKPAIFCSIFAADFDEISFDPDDIITDIETVGS